MRDRWSRRRLARAATVAGAVGLGAGAVAVAVGGSASVAAALTVVGATLLGAGGGGLASMRTDGDVGSDDAGGEDDEATAAVATALGDGEPFDRPAAKRNGDDEAGGGAALSGDAEPTGTDDGDRPERGDDDGTGVGE